MGIGQKIVIVIAAVLLLALIVAVVVGKKQWETGTSQLRASLDTAKVPVQPATVDFSELASLPQPVQRYFRTALTEGQPMVTGVSMQHRGKFNLGETKDKWCRFTSDQKVVAKRPGFDWDGSISLFPGMKVRVHDAYIAGNGLLQASMFGMFTLANMKGAKDLNEGELMRFLAEGAWYPTALLPSQGVEWQPVDDTSAQATLSDGTTTVSLLFKFNENGLVESIRADSRARMVSGQHVPTPWYGRFWNYESRNGMTVPMEGEVSWELPAGKKPYWQGQVTGLDYSFATGSKPAP